MPVPVMGPLSHVSLFAVLLVNALDAWGQTNADAGKQQSTKAESSTSLRLPDSQRSYLSPQFLEPGADPENKLFSPLIKHMAEDQQQFWTSANDLRKPATLETFLPFAGF